ncbi:MAG: translocation/assembly module TamB domain-containing protein [Deltaproteobacteria bacterium]|nr:translocation/assembly module TamB domain-containing protein [Deltaproteobacteria bacterium]
MSTAGNDSSAVPAIPPALLSRRWRHQVVRLVLWAGAVLAALLFLLVLTVRSERAHEQLREYLVEEVSRQLGRGVALGRVEYSLLPPTVELHDLQLADSDPDLPPVFAVERLRLQTGLLDLWRRRWRLRQVEAYRPSLRLRMDSEGRLNLPSLATRSGDRQLRVDVVVLEQGEFLFDQLRIAVEAQAQDVRSRLVGTAQSSLDGQLTSRVVTVTLPGARPFDFDLTLNGKWEPGGLELVSGRLTGKDLAAEFSGSVEAAPGADPQVDIEIWAKGRGEVFSHLGYLTDEVSGPIDSRGNLLWKQGEWSYRGGFEAPRLRWLDFDVANLSGDVAFRDQTLRVEVADGDYVGGKVAGWVGVDFGAESAPVEVDFDFRDLEVDRLLSHQGLPLKGFGSRLEGQLNYRCARPNHRRGTGWGQFFLRPDEQMGIPFVGDLPFTIERGVLSSSAMFVSSEHQRVVAGGTLDLVDGDGEFEFQATSGEVGQVSELLLPYLGGNGQASWVPHQGEGSIEGRLLVTDFSKVAVEIELDLSGVASSELEADRLRGSFRADHEALTPLNLEMTRGQGALLATGQVRYLDSQERQSLVSLNFDSVDWPLEEVASWRALGLPLEGSASGRLTLEGPGVDLGGGFRGFLSKARWAGHEVGTVSTELGWTPDFVDVTRLEAQAPAGVVEVAGRFHRSTEGLDFQFSSQKVLLDQAPVSSYFAGRVGGAVNLEGSVEGTLDNPRVLAEAVFSDLAVAGRPLAQVASQATPDSSRLSLSWSNGDIVAKGSALGLLQIDGGGRLEGESFDLRFGLESSRLRGLAELALGRSLEDLDGDLAGELKVAGNLGADPTAQGSLHLSHLEGSYQSLDVVSAEPVVIDWRQRELRVRSLYLRERDASSEAFVNGTVSFAGSHPVALRLQSSLDLASAVPFLTDVGLPEGAQVSGRADFLGIIGGSLSRPRFDGQGEVKIDPIVVPYFPQPLEGLAARFSFYPDRVELEQMDVESGSGSLRARGTLDLGPDLTGGHYRLYAEGQDLKFLFPDGWLQQGDLELWLRSSDTGRDLQGTVNLEQVRYLEDVEVNLAQAIERILAREREDVGSTNEWLTATQVNVKIRAPNALRVNNRAANLRGDLDLDLRGSLARPVLLGKVDLQPGGILRYADNEYLLERGLVHFSNPNLTEPVIDLVAAARVRRYEVRLSLEGPPDRLALEVTSDPPLPQLDVLALVAGGRPLDPGARPVRPGSPEQGELEAQAFLYGQAASAITDRVNTLFGFDKFRVDPLSQGSDSVSSVRLTVGKRLSKDLFVTYSRDPSSTEGDILEAEWQLGSQLVLVFSQNGDGSFSVDALWDRRF